MPGLNSPLTLGSIVLRNRMFHTDTSCFSSLFFAAMVGNVMSAMTRNRALPCDVPNDVMVEYYRQRAKGGAGLIVTEGALISRQG